MNDSGLLHFIQLTMYNCSGDENNFGDCGQFGDPNQLVQFTGRSECSSAMLSCQVEGITRADPV